MDHYYCLYRDDSGEESKVVKVVWDKAEFEVDHNIKRLDLEVLFEEHLKDLKTSNRSLPCFGKANICVLKNTMRDFAFLYIYDVQPMRGRYILTLRQVKQGESGRCCNI